MKNFTIGVNDAGQRVDRFVSKAMPELTVSQIQKGIRTKNIKRNGGRCKPDDKLAYGDVLAVYVLPLSESAEKIKEVPYIGAPVDIVYEDENILISFKPAGLVCQSEDGFHSLEGDIRKYLSESGSWWPDKENSFIPSVCHRLDRNTSGIVLAAKTAEALRVLNQKIHDREVAKFYTCVVHGHPKPENGELRDYLFKDSKQNLVLVRPDRSMGAKTAILRYRTLEKRESITVLECELVTGRTHQIRVQWASRGHPLVGDGKYGQAALDKPFGQKTQALCAHRIEFRFKTPAGALQYLDGMVFSRSSPF